MDEVQAHLPKLGAVSVIREFEAPNSKVISYDGTSFGLRIALRLCLTDLLTFNHEAVLYSWAMTNFPRFPLSGMIDDRAYPVEGILISSLKA